MGRDKALLPLGPELMLQRVVRLVAGIVEPANIVVVAAPEQQVPDLAADIKVARDVLAYRGPLQGLATGLATIGGRVDAVFVTGCDTPLLVPAFVRRMFELLDDFDIVVPFDGDHHHPLAAVYRLSVLPHAEELLNSGQFSPQALFDVVRTRKVPVEELREVDPYLHTLKNLNQEQDYAAALALAGFLPATPATSSESPGQPK
jgi:molybdopterin-guanine dinucleotide biosynthesis protein A